MHSFNPNLIFPFHLYAHLGNNFDMCPPFRMLEGLLVCIGLSLAMLCGCYLAGLIPLSIKLHEQKMQLVSLLGAGLLAGAALGVIIPEGVDSLYHANIDFALAHLKTVTAAQRSVEVSKPGVTATVLHHAERGPHGEHDGDRKKRHAHSGDDFHDVMIEATESCHKTVGIALTCGFVMMLLIDRFSTSEGHSHSHSLPAPVTGSTPSSTGASSMSPNDVNVSVVRARSSVATLGLLVHSAADGLAMGTAVATAQNTLTSVVFLAIMLHKAPAAFGLVTYLLHEGLDKSIVKRHLAAFSLSAPVSTIITFLVLSLTSSSSGTGEHSTSKNTAGIALLFSAGTFLYIATVHVLPEMLMKPTKTSRLAFIQTITLLIGCIIPLILASGHHH